MCQHSNPEQAIRFRPMTLADLSQVEAIESASFPTPWPREAFIDGLTRTGATLCWVADKGRVDGRSLVIGSIVIWIVHDLAHIGTFAIRPGFRRQGIGQKLLAKALLACVEVGVKKAILEVRASNVPAQKLYDQFGFYIAGLKPGYYADTQEDGLLLELAPLDPVKLSELAESRGIK